MTTVAIPFYNAESTLNFAIASVLRQQLTDWRLLLIDDGSTDKSCDIALTYDDARIRVISDGTNRGLVYRLNQIAELTDTPYLARMDADDVMHPERLAKQVAFMEAHPEVDVVGTGTYTFDNDLRIRGKRGCQPLDNNPEIILRRSLFVHPTVLGRTSWFRGNPYDARFLRAEDHELWLRTCATSHFDIIPEPLHFYREDSGTFNLKAYLASQRTDRMIYRRYGPQRVGWRSSLALMGKSALKGIGFALAKPLGLTRSLLALRNPEQVAANEQKEAEAILSSVLD